MRKWFMLWLASLVVVAALATALTRAQIQIVDNILSGDDIGFRVDGTNQAGAAVGTLMVRVNGQWVAAAIESKPTIHPLR